MAINGTCTFVCVCRARARSTTVAYECASTVADSFLSAMGEWETFDFAAWYFGAPADVGFCLDDIVSTRRVAVFVVGECGCMVFAIPTWSAVVICLAFFAV